MSCGIVLFIYDRPQCTEKVLDSLKKNHIEELYVFQDGLGEQTNKSAWEQNVDIISSIDWCKVIYEKNEYKASSLDAQVIYGINKVFESKDEIIVIEDDCVISSDCIDFMKNCFARYKNNKKVIEIGAYLEPIKVPEDYSLPVIAAGIPAGQVWGTWKDRWEEFQREFSLIKDIGNSMRNNPMFNSCGYPIKRILTDYWMLKTWDLWWSIYVLITEGISLRTTWNKVYNIGFENPGTHTGGKSLWVVPICGKSGSIESLPGEVSIEPWAEAEFKRFYQKVNRKPPRERETYYRRCLEKWLEIKQQGKSFNELLSKKGMKNIAIYGMGSIGKLLVNELTGQNKIEYFIVTNKDSDNFMEYPVYSCDEKLPEEPECVSLIVIPGYDMEEIEKQIGEKFCDIYSLEDILS